MLFLLNSSVFQLAPDEYLALKKADGSYWTTKTRKGKMDMQIFHPKRSQENGRPKWKALGGERKLVTINLEKPQKGMTEVYVKGEKEGVPLDRIY